MSEILFAIGHGFWETVRDVMPIAALLFGFQYFVLRQPIPEIGRILAGFAYVVIGLVLFLIGLEQAIFPLGENMARQLTAPGLIGASQGDARLDYTWVYVFGACIGFATTMAEPALIAVGLKAEKVSGGSVSAFGLRCAVAFGVGVGVALGCYRIVAGMSLWQFILGAYLIVVVQTVFSPKEIIPLAYDSGGVTTSTVTVPLLAALGIGLATHIPGRSPLVDGFGLIAFASVFPIISVLAYAQASAYWLERKKKKGD